MILLFYLVHVLFLFLLRAKAESPNIIIITILDIIY